MKKIIKGGTLVNEYRQYKADIVINHGCIEAILPEGVTTEDAEIIPAEGCYVLPGVIDDQVHFREPGLTHKGNIAEGSRAAAAGGVTSFMDMPNVLPPTTTKKLFIPSIWELQKTTSMKSNTWTPARPVVSNYSWEPLQVTCW